MALRRCDFDGESASTLCHIGNEKSVKCDSTVPRSRLTVDYRRIYPPRHHLRSAATTASVIWSADNPVRPHRVFCPWAVTSHSPKRRQVDKSPHSKADIAPKNPNLAQKLSGLRSLRFLCVKNPPHLCASHVLPFSRRVRTQGFLTYLVGLLGSS